MLFTQNPDSTFSPAADQFVLSVAMQIAAKTVLNGEPLENPRAVRAFLILRFARMEHEVFAVLFLDTRHRVIAFEEMFRGTVDGASVHPREVVKAALKHNATAVIFAHNHPSGVAEPSRADEIITARLKDALSFVDIAVLDHFVISGDQYASFAELGLL